MPQAEPPEAAPQAEPPPATPQAEPPAPSAAAFLGGLWRRATRPKQDDLATAPTEPPPGDGAATQAASAETAEPAQAVPSAADGHPSAPQQAQVISAAPSTPAIPERGRWIPPKDIAPQTAPETGAEAAPPRPEEAAPEEALPPTREKVPEEPSSEHEAEALDKRPPARRRRSFTRMILGDTFVDSPKLSRAASAAAAFEDETEAMTDSMFAAIVETRTAFPWRLIVLGVVVFVAIVIGVVLLSGDGERSGEPAGEGAVESAVSTGS